MKKTIAIFLEFGFHEIKKYIHSGFAEALMANFNVVWIALDKGSKEFDDYFRSTCCPLIYCNESQFNKPLSSVENYNQSVRRNWAANREIGAFHNHSRVRSKSLKSKLVGNSILKYGFEKLTLNYVKNNYAKKQIEIILKEKGVTDILVTGYTSDFVKSAVITAQKNGIKTHYLVNSWKDLYINNFVPFKGLDTIFVWDEKMKENYQKFMPYLKMSNFVISGNPTFDILINLKPNFNRAYYAQKYNIPIQAKWLLYSMMPVGLAPDEIETINSTAKEVLNYFSKDEFVILVKKNPTHQVSDFCNSTFPENISILEHFVSYDKEKDMIVQSKEGETEWLDLLYHSALNLSVPSTVTLEFLSLNKPVLNIAYNSKGEEDVRIKQFFEAGFYKPLFEAKMVQTINSTEELINKLQSGFAEIENQNHKNIVTAAEIISQTILYT